MKKEDPNNKQPEYTRYSEDEETSAGLERTDGRTRWHR
mgnify:CR=1 FL=1